MQSRWTSDKSEASVPITRDYSKQLIELASDKDSLSTELTVVLKYVVRVMSTTATDTLIPSSGPSSRHAQLEPGDQFEDDPTSEDRSHDQRYGREGAE